MHILIVRKRIINLKNKTKIRKHVCIKLNYVAISLVIQKLTRTVKCCIIYFACDNYNLFETRGRNAARLSIRNSR